MTGVDPPDTITWTFDGMEIFSGNESTGGNFTLTISSSGYGMYTCTSTNEFGTKNDSIEIIRACMLMKMNNYTQYSHYSHYSHL